MINFEKKIFKIFFIMEQNHFKLVLSKDGLLLPIPIKSELCRGIFSLVGNNEIPLHSEFISYIFYSGVPISKESIIKMVHIMLTFSFETIKSKVKRDLKNYLCEDLRNKVNKVNLIRYVQMNTDENTSFDAFEEKLRKDFKEDFRLNYKAIENDINVIFNFKNFDMDIFKGSLKFKILNDPNILSYVFENFTSLKATNKRGKTIYDYVSKYSNHETRIKLEYYIATLRENII